MELGTELQQVVAGRIFARRVSGAPQSQSRATGQLGRSCEVQLIFGVVDVPKHADLERMHEVRINSRLWMETKQAKRPQTHMSPEGLAECDLGSVISFVQFGASPIRDHGAVFLRASLIPHERTDRRWAFIAGALQAQDLFQENGIYEFDGSREGFHRVGTCTHNGDAISSVMRMPIWGPGGAWGTATSMEPKTYARWIVAERKRTASKEPEFAAFSKMMEVRCPELLVYSAEQYAEREAAAREVIKEIIAKRDEPHTAPPAPAPRRARP